MRNWRSYIGLPYVPEANPADGKGADCLVMTLGILDDLGLSHPPFDPETFYQLTKRDAWWEVERLWLKSTEPIEAPEDGAVTLLQNGRGGLGVGVVIEGGLLMVHHRRGVIWVPLHLLKPFPFRRFIA